MMIVIRVTPGVGVVAEMTMLAGDGGQDIAPERGGRVARRRMHARLLQVPARRRRHHHRSCRGIDGEPAV